MGSISLEVFADADYVSKAVDRQLMTNGAVMCRCACVFWFSRTPNTLVLGAP